ncbi:hypothetical protein C8J56DRAFT_882104 [Mycena floridula]|nr:hypothetical protein C8J56DRAFT_882104 [Mycena floridula]
MSPLLQKVEIGGLQDAVQRLFHTSSTQLIDQRLSGRLRVVVASNTSFISSPWNHRQPSHLDQTVGGKGAGDGFSQEPDVFSGGRRDIYAAEFSPPIELHAGRSYLDLNMWTQRRIESRELFCDGNQVGVGTEGKHGKFYEDLDITAFQMQFAKIILFVPAYNTFLFISNVIRHLRGTVHSLQARSHCNLDHLQNKNNHPQAILKPLTVSSFFLISSSI